MSGPVLVPLDGSALAEWALPLGTSIAQHTGRPLWVVQVVPVPTRAVPSETGGVLTVDEMLDVLRSRAREYLSRVEEQVKATGVSVEGRIVTARTAAEGIAEVADEHHAAFVVMATHGYTGLSRWALGSVTDRVLHLTKRPLIAVRPPQGEERITLTAEALPLLKRIVVPLDGSRLAEHVLPCVIDLAHAYGTKLFLYRVLTMPFSGLGVDAGFALSAEFWNLAREEAETYLKGVAGSLQQQGIDVSYDVGTEPVADAILAFADQVEADLIAMTTHAREGLTRLIMGSVADRIVRAGHVPVLVVRPETEAE